jgi:hypothetical protein
VLAQVLGNQQRYNEALPFYQTLCKSYYLIYGDKHHLTLAVHRDFAKTKLRMYERDGPEGGVGEEVGESGVKEMEDSSSEVTNGDANGKQGSKASKLAYALAKIGFKNSKTSTTKGEHLE